jgi:hypothetical protein
LGLWVVGTLFYHFVEGMELNVAWYFTWVSITTIGYGDICVESTTAKVFTAFFLVRVATSSCHFLVPTE